MHLSILDILIVLAYLLFCLVIGFVLTKRAGKNIEEFFLSGRNLPWWLLGTSMVATTFSADTPLAVTGLVVKEGVAGNWLWWNTAISGVFTLLFLSRLWRKSGIFTDLELIAIRYSGIGAHILRGFRALWEGILINCLVMGWATLAMGKILTVIFPISKGEAVAISLGIALFYSLLSGLWGVIATDFVQFIISIAGSIGLALVSLSKVGGIERLKVKIFELYGSESEIFDIFPLSGEMMPLSSLAVFLAINWWASKGADGGGYIAQRMLAAKSEKDSFFGYLWFLFAHYILRPWPWIITALCSAVLLPGLEDPEMGYPMLVAQILPAGIKGLLLASFFSAFMSTIDTHLNFGASYVVNDFIRTFILKKGSIRSLVRISRGVVLLLCIITLVITFSLKSVGETWKLLFSLTSGIGGVYIMRWLWWRVNAWSEISAWISSGLTFICLKILAPDMEFGVFLGTVSSICTATWVTVTLLTPPTDRDRLRSFFEKVRPPSLLWKGFIHSHPSSEDSIPFSKILLQWILLTIALFSTLSLTGKLILGFYSQSLLLTIPLILSLVLFFLFSHKDGDIKDISRV